MKKYLLILNILFISLVSLGQNLVPNPSFETISNCNDTVSPSVATSKITPWVIPTDGSADSFHSSCGSGCMGTSTPCNMISYQPTHSGVGYAGLIAASGAFGTIDNNREYLQVQLTSPLVAGQDYCVEFYASLAANPAAVIIAINSLGAYLSSTPVTASGTNPLNVTPQVVSSSYVSDTVGWTLIQSTFTATGGEQYITIGNFNDASSTSTQTVYSPQPGGPMLSYYFIDDVSVTSGACSSSPACDSTINPFGPFCSTDVPSNLTAVTPNGTWSGTGITDANAGTFDPATAGIGTHQITYTAPCGSSNTIDVVVNDCSTITASFTASNTNLCVADCISFTNTSSGVGNSATYSWSFAGATPSTSTDVNPTNICYPATGTYDVTLTVTENGNSDDSVMTGYVTVVSCSTPIIDFTPSDDTICQTNCITFTNNSGGGSIGNFAWSFTGGTPSSALGANPPQVCYDTPGNYTVTLVAVDASNNVLGQKDTTIVVESCPLPTANFTVNNPNICEEGCVSFTDQSFGMVGTATYEWQFPGANTTTSNAQNPSGICYTNIGTYDVTLSVTDNNGTATITITDAVVVSECDPPVPVFTLPSNVICTGQCINFTNESTNADSYEWIFEGGFPGGSTDENPTNICFESEGTFDIQLIAFNTLTSDTLHHTLTVAQPPSVTASDDVTIFEGTNTLLTVETDGSTYLWSPSETLSCDDCMSTVAEPDSTTLYTITVTADNGCAVTDSVLVTVVEVTAIGVPSAFSPNGDKVNDVLYVEGAGIEKMNFIVYNRYGEKIFESSKKSFGWDGKYKGKPENPGVFVYTLEYVLRNGETGVLKGNVTLVK